MTTKTPLTGDCSRVNELVRSLAIRYNAYQDANDKGDIDGIWVWGRMLREAEDEIGLRIGKREYLDDNIASARRTLDRIGAK